MAQNNINFIRTNGIGGQDANNDHISGLIGFTAALPSGFAANDRVKKIFSIEQAEALGIVDTFSDETKATGGNIEITTNGAAGDIETITIDGVLLGTVTVPATPYADVTAEAVALRAAINALTIKHGFSSAGSAGNVTIVPPTGMGVVSNTATIAFTSTTAAGAAGTGAATATQLSSGVGSWLAAMHYHIKEFFRIKSDGVLYVGLYAAPTTFNGAELKTLQDAANGECRQIGIYYPNAVFASSQLTGLDAYADILNAEHKPVFSLLHSSLEDSSLAALVNIAALTAPKAACVIGEDGNWHQPLYVATKGYLAGDKVRWMDKTYIANRDVAAGVAPYEAEYYSVISTNLCHINDKSISCLGALLGSIAASNVGNSVAYVAKNNVSDGTNLEEAGFVTKVLYKDQATSLLDTLDTYGWIYLRKYQNVNGTYFSNSWTAASRITDYATIENNRTMDKAERLVYAALAPEIASPVTVDNSGKLSQSTIDKFQSLVYSQLEQMARDGEISPVGTISQTVPINAAQNVLQTGKINIAFRIIPVGVARTIEVNNSYVLKF